MTQNKRIAINTIVSYGRSMIGVACGIFATRWVLEALGDVDYGLYGLVGSLAIFLSFISIQSAHAIARYYAFSIGQQSVAENKAAALEECRVWFSVALLVHLVLPCILVAIGWPLGEYAITHAWLKIPPDRVATCVWLWRFVCMSCFIGMVQVPFHAMYTAKQYIAELTIYSLAQTLARTGFIYYMVTHPGDWLMGYGLGMLIVAIAPQLIIASRAYIVFPECRFVRRSFLELARIKHLANYAFWQSVGGIGYLAGHQIMAIILNKGYGPRYNASFAISQTVAGEAGSLTGALQIAFAPAITTACGAGSLEGMRTMAFRSCKIGTLLTMIFALPMMLEIDELLLLWLKNPPPYASEMCIATLAFIVIEKLSCGHVMAVNAMGKVSLFQCVHGLLRITAIPLALIPIYLKLGVVATMTALPISIFIVILGDVYLSRRLAGMSAIYWFKSVLLPILSMFLIGLLIGQLPVRLLPQSFLRMAITSVLVVITLIPISWFAILSASERDFLARKLKLRK